jgi:phage host-nuclease inhibitor protein Gam
MPAKPKKAKLPAIETDAQLHDTVDEIARLEVRVRSLEAKRDAAIQHFRIEQDATIETHKARLASLMKLASTYATVHKATLFAGAKKSAASALARFGFRSGNPTLKVLNNKWNMDTVLVAVKKLGKYFRTVEELDKQAIHEAKLSDAELAAIGLRIDSGERFFVESKSEDADRLNAEPEETAAV